MTDKATITPDDSDIEAEKEVPAVDLPELVDVNAFQQSSLNDLHAKAQELGLRVAGVRSKHQLVFEILKYYGDHGVEMTADGFLDFSGDNFGF